MLRAERRIPPVVDDPSLKGACMAKAKKQSRRKYPYHPKYIQLIREHFNVEAGEWVTVTNAKTGEKELKFRAVDLPMYQTFARSIGVPSRIVREWATEKDEEGNLVNPEFAEVYDEVKDHQTRILVHNGLHDAYKTAFAIFTAKNILGWRDAYSHNIAGIPNAPPITINANMSAQEAAEAYADSLKAQREG